MDNGGLASIILFVSVLEGSMAVAANKRSVMTLFSSASDLYSHQVRIVLAEKA